MAETSHIEWTDATVNYWWGCTKVGPGCDGCYAEAWDYRLGGSHWGIGVPRRKIASAGATLARLQRQADRFEAEHGRRQRIFMSSMSDLFDNEVPAEWRREAFADAEASDRLDIQFLTKRVTNVPKMVPDHWQTDWPKHIGLMITVVNQEEANRDIPRLLELERRFCLPWVGISAEPLLGPLNLQPYVHGIDWVIVGGESGANARIMHPDWPRQIRDDCARAGAAFFFKQWGEWCPRQPFVRNRETRLVLNDGRVFGDVHQAMNAEWTDNPATPFAMTVMTKLGKKKAGRVLDCCTHDEFPGATS